MTTGDQILAYSGDAASPTFLFAVDFADGNTGYAGDATNANTSAVPTGLTEGTDAAAEHRPSGDVRIALLPPSSSGFDQRVLTLAGYDPTPYAGHSLRAGFLTEGAAQGATIFKLQEVSRHKSIQVLSDYVRNAELFKDHAGNRFL